MARGRRFVRPGGADDARVAKENLAIRKDELRSVFPNAYAPWSADEDARLLAAFAQGKNIERRYAKINEEFRDEHLQGNASRRLKKSIKRTAERAEFFYGNLDNAGNSEV